MSLLNDYNKNKQIQILYINSEHSELVKKYGCKVKDFVVTKIGSFYYDINKSGFVSVFEFGVCPDFELTEVFSVITKSEADKLKNSILSKKDILKANEIEIKNLKEQLAKALKENKK